MRKMDASKTVFKDLTYGQYLEEWSEKYADRIALKQGDIHVTYKELKKKAHNMAAFFLGKGVTKGDNVLIQLTNTVTFVTSCFGLFEIGAVPVLVYPACREKELESIIETSKPVAYISSDVYKGFEYKHMAEALVNKYEYIKHLYFESEILGMDMECYDLEKAEYEKPCPGDVAVIVLSGGSTGTPKLIARTHADHAYTSEATAEACNLYEEGVFLLSMPAAHNFNLCGPGLLGTLCAGGTVVMCDSGTPEEILELIDKEKVNATALVPALAASCLTFYEKANKYDISSLKVIQLGGSMCTPETVKQVMNGMNCTVQQIYGMGEGVVFCTSLSDSIDTIMNCQGKTISPSDEIKIVDENDEVLPVGTFGELLIKGPCVIKGYYRADEINKKKFTEDGFYRTGDRVRLLEDGNIQVAGRVIELINRGGEKIMPVEIEEYLCGYKGVEEASVVPIKDAMLGQKVCAFVLSKQNDISPVDIRNYLVELGIASYKVPDHIYILDKWPLTAVNKIDRNKLIEMATEKAKESIIIEEECLKGLSEMEQQIAKIWCKALNCNSVYYDDDFFEHGGNSLSGSIMIQDVNELFQSSVDIGMLYEDSSFKGFIQCVKENQ